jgi:hypothetical protein
LKSMRSFAVYRAKAPERKLGHMFGIAQPRVPKKTIKITPGTIPAARYDSYLVIQKWQEGVLTNDRQRTWKRKHSVAHNLGDHQQSDKLEKFT